MRFEGIDLNLLVILDALIEEKSVTKASLRLNVSQPAVSAALAKLRWHTNDDLLQKVGRDIQLTPRAEEMARPVRELLLQVREVLKKKTEFDPSITERNFSIAASIYAAQVTTPFLTSCLVENYPNIKYEIELLSYDSIRRVRNNDVDLCIVSHQMNLLNSRESIDDVTTAPFFSDRWVVICDAANTSIETCLTLDEFLSLPYVATHFGGGTLTVVENQLKKFGLTPNVVATTPDFHLAVRNVVNSPCIAIVPERLLRDRELHGIRTFSPPFEIPDLNEWLVWHSRHDTEPGHKWFRELVLAAGDGTSATTAC